MLRLDGAAVDRREGRGRSCSGMKGSTFPARKALTQARKLGHDGVVRAIDLLADADLDLRGGKAWPDELVMEVLVARLARLAADSGPGPALHGRRPGRADQAARRDDAGHGPASWRARGGHWRRWSARRGLDLATSRDLRRAAWFLWITPLAAALSMRLMAAAGASSASSAPASAAVDRRLGTRS